MAKNPKFRSNTKWSLEDEDRLAAMISSGMSVIAMATEMQRSYRAIEDRIWKIKRSEAKTELTADLIRYRDNPRDNLTMNLSCRTINEMATPLVEVLYNRLTAYRAITIAKSNKYKTIKPRFEKVIAAIVRELLIAPSQNEAFVWVQVSISRVRSSQIGINTEIFQNLIDGLCENGFVDRLSGYSNLQFRAEARRGRPTRLRATTKLIALCKQYNVTAENAMHCFSGLEKDDVKSPPVPPAG